MAEFVEVMKQAKRMCEARDECTDCPLNELLHACGGDKDLNCIASLCEGEAEFAEHSIMKWAEAHPEPTYPTWNEWYKATFPNSNYHTIPCPSMFYKICETSNYHGEVECYECKNRPIPADIAEKLGIKPIGGDEDV